MCEHVCIFITCYNLHYSSKIKQSPLQQNPVYNRKPWEGSLHVSPVQDSYPMPSRHFCWMFLAWHPGTWHLTHCSLQEGQHFTGTLLCPCAAPTCSITPPYTHPGCCLGWKILLLPSVVPQETDSWWWLVTEHTAVSRALAYSVYKLLPKQW